MASSSSILPNIFTHGKTTSPGHTPTKQRLHLVNRSPESFALRAPTQDEIERRRLTYLRAIRNGFEAWDVDADNIISRQDVELCLRHSNLQFSENDVADVIKQIGDVDKVAWEAYRDACLRKMELMQDHFQAPPDIVVEMEAGLRAGKRDPRYHAPISREQSSA